MSREIASAYFHIENGGTTFKVVDEGYGPTVVLASSHFGTNSVEHRLHVRPEDLKVLARMFDVAANDKRYSETYCVTAKADRRSCKPIGKYDDLLPPAEKMVSCCGGASPKVMKMSMMQEAAPDSRPKKDSTADKTFREVVDKLHHLCTTSKGFFHVTRSYQDVRGEILTGEGVEGYVCVYDITRQPIEETLRGTIEIAGLPIQSFSESKVGGSMINLGLTEVWVENMMRIGKKLYFRWNQPPGLHTIVVDYEYEPRFGEDK